jgi:hypothetical protein
MSRSQTPEKRIFIGFMIEKESHKVRGFVLLLFPSPGKRPDNSIRHNVRTPFQDALQNPDHRPLGLAQLPRHPAAPAAIPPPSASKIPRCSWAGAVCPAAERKMSFEVQIIDAGIPLKYEPFSTLRVALSQ